MSPVPITGPTLPALIAGQDPPSRLEINVFVNNDNHFSLYVQALQAIYSQSQGDLLSFFQISGIHGLPYIEWNQSPGGESGYCSHGTNIFPTWHRPYVALFEQAIQARAVQIAATYKVDTARWGKAAADLRQPYWDWALNSVPPTQIISDQKVTITTPDGRRTLVDNPFLHYRFHPDGSSPRPPPPQPAPAPFLRYNTTLRHPKNKGTSVVEDLNELRNTLSSAQFSISEDTYNLFSVTSWPEFSNHSTTGGFTNSLETIHDGLHTAIGGKGHMSYPSFAAFDPIFYLHHCQVDRVLAMWSMVHSDVWVPDEDINQDLTPFWDATTSFWVSANVKSSATLNYSYPEVTSDVSASQQAIMDWLAQISQNIRQRSPGLQGFSALATSGLSAGLATAPQAALSVATEAPRTEPITIQNWSARIRCNQYEFGSSFSVFLFLVKIPEDPAQWLTSPYFVGTFDAFVNTDADKCANCRNQADRDIEGFVHINAGILQHSGQQSLEADQVVPWLTTNLHWRVKKLDGTVAELQSLEVTVVATPLSLPAGADLPTAGEPRHHHEVTRGRTGVA